MSGLLNELKLIRLSGVPRNLKEECFMPVSNFQREVVLCLFKKKPMAEPKLPMRLNIPLSRRT